MTSFGNTHARLLLALAGLVSPVAVIAESALPETVVATNRVGQANVLSPERLEALNTVIGDIRISSGDVFDTGDPAESGAFYRVVNALHLETRDDVIRRQLLLRSGETYSADKVAETERSLRANHYLKSAQILPITLANGAVDLEVITGDTWSLMPSISFSRKGGTNTGGLEIEESNLLGTGSEIALGYKSKLERDEAYLTYQDSQIGTSRFEIDLSAADASDGAAYRLRLQQPFYALDARRAGGIYLETFDQIDPLYQLGEIYDEVLHEANRAEAFYGWSNGLRDNRVTRLTAGAGYDEAAFSGTDGAPRPADAPADRRDIYPFVAWEWLHNRYETARNADNIERVEDRFLGSRIAIKAGYASEMFGSNDDAWLYGLDMEKGYKFSASDTMLLSGAMHGRQAVRDSDSYRIDGRARWYHRQATRRLLYAELWTSFGENVDTDEQIALGGDNGLRGYPVRYQAGKASALLTVEQRFYSDWYPFHLFRVGAAAFVDVGKVWDVTGPPGAALGLLRDVGVGLRITSPHSSSGRMLHIDLAYPLDGPESIRGAQIVIETSKSF